MLTNKENCLYFYYENHTSTSCTITVHRVFNGSLDKVFLSNLIHFFCSLFLNKNSCERMKIRNLYSDLYKLDLLAFKYRNNINYSQLPPIGDLSPSLFSILLN